MDCRKTRQSNEDRRSLMINHSLSFTGIFVLLIIYPIAKYTLHSAHYKYHNRRRQLFSDQNPMIFPEGKMRVPSPQALFDTNLPIKVIPLYDRVPCPSKSPFLNPPS